MVVIQLIWCFDMKRRIEIEKKLEKRKKANNSQNSSIE